MRWRISLMAGRAVLTSALLVSIAGMASAQQTTNSFTAPEDVVEGARLFRNHCGGCHGPNARGGDIGPNLTTGRFTHATSDAAMFRVISEGVAGTEMIGIYRGRTDKQVWQLVTFIRSLTARPEDAKLAGNAESGRALFAGKGDCRRCHMVGGEGGRLGPDLSLVGDQRSPADLQFDLTDPNRRMEPRWWTLKVTRPDGSVIEGFRMDEDTFSVRLMDRNENLWSFMKREVRSIERIETSTMPSFANLSAKEVDDLVAYLYSLRKRS